MKARSPSVSDDGPVATEPVRQPPTETAAVAPPARARRARIPAWVWGVALLAALVHMAPYVRAQAQTPDGYTFSGNLSISPDYMQYRVWMRQTQREGPVVSDLFTTEPNGRHLPVPLYWTMGKVASITGVTPEWTYAWFGAFVAVAFTVVLYGITRTFLRDERAVRWTFGTLLLAGGLGGYLVLFESWDWARTNYWIDTLLLQPLVGDGNAVLFERFRGNYIIQALFDTHFLTFWLMTAVAVAALHATVRRFSYGRLAGTAALFAFATFLHVYEGLTLLAIAAGALGMVAVRGGAPRRQLLATFVACGGAVFLALLPAVILFRSSGLPAPSWRGETLVFAVFVLAYPLALGLIAWGFGRYWRAAGTDEAFLVGWALACSALVLSGPFFPYPDRGTMTLQIPLFLIAAAIWFGRGGRMNAPAIAALVLLLGSTPFWMTRSWIDRTTFDAAEMHKWLDGSQSRIVALLRERATPDDVLVADQPNLRWLAPEYPGRHYAGHFFLTVDFRAKQESLASFYEADSDEERRAFLDRWNVRWLFIDDVYETAAFARLPGVTVLADTPVGALLEVSALPRTGP